LIQESVANCLVAYVRLVERGKEDLAYPTVLAMFAVKQIRDGRRVHDHAEFNLVWNFVGGNRGIRWFMAAGAAAFLGTKYMTPRREACKGTMSAVSLKQCCRSLSR
jgi:hypothetical protein